MKAPTPDTRLIEMPNRFESPGQMARNLEPICFERTQAIISPAPIAVDADWTKGLPVLQGRKMRLRELVKTDARTMLSMLSIDEVAKFISPPPTTPQGFEKFIQWTIRERKAGHQFTFGLVPDGCDHAAQFTRCSSFTAVAPRN
jgi:hypothetical protein